MTVQSGHIIQLTSDKGKCSHTRHRGDVYGHSVETQAKLNNRVDPITKHTHTLQSVVHLAIVKDDFVITWLDSAKHTETL